MHNYFLVKQINIFSTFFIISYLKHIQKQHPHHSEAECWAAPLSFIVGKGQIIPGLEEKIKDLKVGEKADIKVAAVDAYGVYDDNAVQTLPKEQFAGIELSEGMSLYGQGEHGETIQVVVKSFDDTSVTIDYNHPMAGRTLMFSVAILSLRDATEEEIQSGVVGGFAAMGGGCCGGGGCGTGHDHDDHDHGHSHGGGCGTGGGHGGCGCH